MGVHGLTTFVEGNRHFLFDVKLRDSRLVIDGSSLYFNLYLKHGLDRQHGGEYDAFASLVLEFVSALRACNIEPYVILDGGIDPSNKKYHTLQQRLLSKIKEAENLSYGRNGSVLPILTKQVFIEVLNQNKVPLVQSLAEADWDIACLAHQWKCPVLSNDSDFFIFDLPGGYMPWQFFNWTNLNGKASYRYIPTRCYTTQALCRFYGGMNPELLPLFAVLAGNDYATPKEAERLLDMIDRTAGSRRNHKSSSSRVDVLLRWLSSFPSPAQALAEVKRLMGANSGGGLSTQLKALMKEYHVTPQSPFNCWFTDFKVPEGHNQTLPKGLSVAATGALLPALVIDALVMRRVLLNPQVENSRQPSSHRCATPIRQAIYGILLLEEKQMEPVGFQQLKGQEDSFTQRGGKSQASVATPRQVSPVCVEEIDRLNFNLKKIQVEAQRLKSHFHVNAICEVTGMMRRNAICEVLRVNPSALAQVPASMYLPIAATSFWLQEAAPKPSQLHLQALILGMVYGELVLMEKNQISNYQIPVPKDNSFERRLIRQLDQIRLSSRDAMDIAAAHGFSQWQACLWSAQCLNQLLLLPFNEVHFSHLFSGSMVHSVLNLLKKGHTVDQMLPKFSYDVYSILLHAVKNCSFKPQLASVRGGRGRGGERGRRGRGRGRGEVGGGRGRGRRGTEGISNRFAVLGINE
ncbi:protein asteroid homolog 1 [Syngnathus acus]|uniref:protein asteroid homolog 1 n=1 Tax=Syngnathus acus TaxID=161584 RepID=UPI0018862DBA|nr:protein asteroid homolog 1 [Syngnathus acus]